MDNEEAKIKLAAALAEWLPSRMEDWKVPGVGIAAFYGLCFWAMAFTLGAVFRHGDGWAERRDLAGSQS